MDPGRELVPSWGRGGWSQVCQAAGDTSPPPGLPEMGRSRGGMRGALHCSQIPQPSARAGGRRWKLSLVLPSVAFILFSLLPDNRNRNLWGFFPSWLYPFCSLTAEDAGAVQRVGLWWWEMSHAWDSRKAREDWKTLISKPFHSPPQKSHLPLPALLSQQLPKPPGVPPASLVTVTCLPCLSPLTCPDFCAYRLWQLWISQRDLTACTPCPSLPGTNTKLILHLLLRVLEVAPSWCVTGECCGDERLLGKEFRTSCVCVCALGYTWGNTACVWIAAHPSKPEMPGGRWYPSVGASE